MVGYTKEGENVYESKRLDHLGLVAGMVEELGLGEEVDKALGSDAGSKLSPSMCLKATIVNGLGFTTRPLYLRASYASPSSKTIKPSPTRKGNLTKAQHALGFPVLRGDGGPLYPAQPNRHPTHLPQPPDPYTNKSSAPWAHFPENIS